MTDQENLIYQRDKELLLERKKFIEGELSNRYELITINGNPCFRVSDNLFIHVEALEGSSSAFIIIEYSESEAQMRAFDSEDGASFHPSDYNTSSDMFNAILQEIQS